MKTKQNASANKLRFEASQNEKTNKMKTHIFEPRNKCPRCGSKALYYKREGKRINIVRCDLCTALWKEKSEYLAARGEPISDFVDSICKLGDGPVSKFADQIIKSN